MPSHIVSHRSGVGCCLTRPEAVTAAESHSPTVRRDTISVLDGCLDGAGGRGVGVIVARGPHVSAGDRRANGLLDSWSVHIEVDSVCMLTRTVGGWGIPYDGREQLATDDVLLPYATRCPLDQALDHSTSSTSPSASATASSNDSAWPVSHAAANASSPSTVRTWATIRSCSSWSAAENG
jgi:hypothetical protein